MYKEQSKQIGIMDFNMPLGMKLASENRWVKKAAIIPWDEIETRYASLFKSKTGNVAKPLRMALGALLIQTERQISDVEVMLQIQETPCLQYFCGLPGYTDERPFDPSLMVWFRKRLTSEILGEINELIISRAEKPAVDSPVDQDDAEPPNEGTLIMDSTCAPQNIRYPQDLSLLNEARENLERMIDELHDTSEGEKPRTYRRTAKQEYLSIVKSKHKTAKQIHKAQRKQLRYIRRDLATVAAYLLRGKELSAQKSERLSVIRRLYEQQLFMHTNHCHRVDDRIVSITQPWIRPIVRGKSRAKCEFGAKLDISVSDGFVRLEHTSFDAYNESENLKDIIERYRERTGHYPERVLADKIYRNRENLSYCKEWGIRLTGKPLGRPKQDGGADKKQLRLDETDRIEVERKFSHAKSSFGLGLIRTRLQTTSKTAIAMSILALNIAFVARILPALFRRIVRQFAFVSHHSNLCLVQ
jgi:hypothetical protein